jgi:hypothetical protein
MGRIAQSAWILRLFAAALCVVAPISAFATATALGVALNANAGCSNGDLNITLTTVDAHREGWQATNLTSVVAGPVEQPTSFSNVTNFTISPFRIGFNSAQPAGTLVASYAYVGETPPNAAEFFVYYNCTTRQVLLACFGPYGTCPQTAQQAATLLAPQVPTLGAWGLLSTALLIGAAGTIALRRRRA